MSIKINLQECCYICDHSRIDVIESRMETFDGEEYKDVLIKCENVKICKYLEKAKEQSNESS